MQRHLLYSLIRSIDLTVSSSLQPHQLPIAQRLHDYIAGLPRAIFTAAAASIVLVSGKVAQRYITLKAYGQNTQHDESSGLQIKEAVDTVLVS